MSDESQVYIVRGADKEEWTAKAKEGEGIAVVCVRAAGEFMENISNKALHCTCCEALFSPSNLPQAFIVMQSNTILIILTCRRREYVRGCADRHWGVAEV